MTKKRYTLSLSRCLARKFDLVARQRHGAKSAIVEEAIRVQLEQPQHPGIEEGMADGSTT
jgi:predicted transcriptional regulator